MLVGAAHACRPPGRRSAELERRTAAGFGIVTVEPTVAPMPFSSLKNSMRRDAVALLIADELDEVVLVGAEHHAALLVAGNEVRDGPTQPRAEGERAGRAVEVQPQAVDQRIVGAALLPVVASPNVLIASVPGRWC